LYAWSHLAAADNAANKQLLVRDNAIRAPPALVHLGLSLGRASYLTS
jgi:hypothetical protein